MEEVLPAGIILAGGQSRRMGGGDKTMLLLAGRPMIEHAIARLAPQVSALAINANSDPDRFAHLGLDVVADTIAGFQGPLAGVLAGLEWAGRQTARPSRIVTVAADTPFFPAALVSRLSDAVARAPDAIAVASSDGRRHPVFALWPVSLRDELAAWLADPQDLSVAGFLARNDVAHVEFEDEHGFDPFFNINTPDDLERAQVLHATGEVAR